MKNKEDTPKKLMVDPPSGWKYGFPKELKNDDLKDMTFEEWLVKNGYPKKDAEFGAKYCRMWQEDKKPSKGK